MLSLRGIPTDQLTALRFPDQATFYAATELIAGLRISVEPMGSYTIIIRKSDRGQFSDLLCEERPVVDQRDLSPDELKALRRRDR